jgi:hypothetical protein
MALISEDTTMKTRMIDRHLGTNKFLGSAYVPCPAPGTQHHLIK